MKSKARNTPKGVSRTNSNQSIQQMEWACLMIKDLDQLPTAPITLPGDKLWELRDRLQNAKSQLEQCLFRYEDLSIHYAAVLASMKNEGPGIQPFMNVPLHMDREPTLPSSAQDLQEYQKICQDFPDVWRVKIEQAVQGKVDEYQDGKDLQRDNLILNGEFIAGSEYGYARIVEAVQNWCEDEEVAKKILQALNRTTSGGTAFDRILQTFGQPDLVDITPASKEAKPLTVAVSKDGAIGCAHTQYLIFDQITAEKILEVDTYFTFRMVNGSITTIFLFIDRRCIPQKTLDLS